MRRFRVALLIETSLIYGRELHEGVADFFESEGHWSLFMDQRELEAAPPLWFTRQRWDGVISRITSRPLARAIRRMNVAAVDLTDRSRGFGFPRILSDHRMIGAWAADHLFERRFRRFAYCGYDKEAWSQERFLGFRTKLQDRGFECEAYNSPWAGSDASSWDAEGQRLGRWLKKLPLPIGVMACNDQRGQQVLESCRRSRLDVPRDVAVIGVDNDRLMCRLSDPPLSSVVPDARRIGYEAARRLDQLMRGARLPCEDRLIPPVRIVTRQSTETLAVDEPDVAAALQFIHQRACEGISVSNVLDSVPVSRSLLERRFREHVGRTPHQEIRRVQMERAVELVSETELPLKQIAGMCGLHHVEYLSYLFRNAPVFPPESSVVGMASREGGRGRHHDSAAQLDSPRRALFGTNTGQTSQEAPPLDDRRIRSRARVNEVVVVLAARRCEVRGEVDDAGHRQHGRAAVWNAYAPEKRDRCNRLPGLAATTIWLERRERATDHWPLAHAE